MKKKTLLASLALLCTGTAVAQTGKTTYEYDDLNRLVRVVSPAGETIYNYDELGNRTSKQFKADESLGISATKANGISIVYVPERRIVRITDAKADETCQLLNAGGVVVAEAKTDRQGTAELPAGITGAYLVQVGRYAKKVMCE